MSFCRITGRCKALPKPNYFPLLPPISPSDAKRFCRITGKSYGLPSHHYIPVIVSKFQKKPKYDLIDASAENKYGQRKHTILAEYQYMFPEIDTSNSGHKQLIDILDEKSPSVDGHFVYKVEERKFHLVFPPKLEAALRDGDVRDLMLGKDCDTIRMKINRGTSVIIGLKSLNDSDLVDEFFEGEGPTDDVLREIEKEQAKETKKKRKLSKMMKMFEEKQNTMDEEIEKICRSQEKGVTLRKENESQNGECRVDEFKMQDEKMTQLSDILMSGDSCDLMNPFIESWNWETYRKELQNVSSLNVISKKMPTAHTILPFVTTKQEIIADELIAQNLTGFDVISWIGELPQQTERPDEKLIAAIHNRKYDDIVRDKVEIQETLSPDSSYLSVNDIYDIVKCIDGETSLCEVEKKIGVFVNCNNKKIFMPGRMILEKFIPGQTIDETFIPGLTIKSESGEEAFIPGYILNSSNNTTEKVFVSGITIDGTFVCGQFINNLSTDEKKFVEGRTIMKPEGVKFVPGIDDDETHTFVPGQFISNQFIPGQIINDKYIPGQTVLTESGEWVFIPGQTVDNVFIPGKTIITEDGSKFIAGQIIDNTFIPGMVQNINGTRQFVPGTNIETINGAMFVQGQIIKTDKGEIFHPGKTVVDENNVVTYFEVAKSATDIIFHDAINVLNIVDPNTMISIETSLSIFGNMIQTQDKIEFYPNKMILDSSIPNGNIVPGKLIKQNGKSKFIPGIITDEDFCPGQVVWTETGEQFIPGQVIETSDGLKFVPGQVIETKTGKKFVPGQTIETEFGPRFVPGQIIYTKSGPTFIPGQIMATEDGVERFIPGQVVDTDYGPQFVPGSVIETDDIVTFVPGQIVETSEGLKFIAPDLMSNADGEDEFSLQSFQVSPEELQLIKISPQCSGSNTGNFDLTFDSNMMQQLSAAGITIGQQVQASVVDFVLQSTKDKQTVKTCIAEHFSDMPIDEDSMTNVFNEIKIIIEALSTCDQSKIVKNILLLDPLTRRAIDILTSTVMAVKKSLNDDSNLKSHPYRKSEAIYELIGRGLVQSLEKSEEVVILLNAFKSFRKSEIVQHVKRNITQSEFVQHESSKCEMVKNLSALQSQDELEIFNKIFDIMHNETELMDAFQLVAQDCPKIVHKVVQKLRDIGSGVTEANAVDLVKRSIANAVKNTIEQEVKKIVASSNIENNSYSQSILQQALGLSRALHLPENITSAIICVLNKHKNVNDLFDDVEIAELICRVHLMNKLAENDNELKGCLSELQQMSRGVSSSNTNHIKLSKLVRESGLLIIESQYELASTPSNSKLTSVLMTGNLLQIEDFLVRCGTKSKGAFLILKNGLQMVVPRELSHDIITGKCPFTVLDDNGIRHFEPAHMFSLLRTKNQHLLSHRFSMYSCDISDINRL